MDVRAKSAAFAPFDGDDFTTGKTGTPACQGIIYTVCVHCQSACFAFTCRFPFHFTVSTLKNKPYLKKSVFFFEMDFRLTEQLASMRNGHPERIAVAEHSLDTGHRLKWKEPIRRHCT